MNRRFRQRCCLKCYDSCLPSHYFWLMLLFEGSKVVFLGSENMVELKQLTGVKLKWNKHSEHENTVESEGRSSWLILYDSEGHMELLTSSADFSGALECLAAIGRGVSTSQAIPHNWKANRQAINVVEKPSDWCSGLQQRDTSLMKSGLHKYPGHADEVFCAWL